MNKINSTIVGRQSSMDDIRGYFNRVYNQMKEDPEGRYPANFEDFWRLFFDRRENAILFSEIVASRTRTTLLSMKLERKLRRTTLSPFSYWGCSSRNFVMT